MWSTSYLISQICMILAMGCFCLSLFTKNKKLIIIISATNAVLYSLHYFLLGKISVVLLNVLSIVRGIFFYYDDRDEIKHNFVSLIFITLSLVLVSYNTLITWVDLLPLIAVLLYTFSLWWKNITFYRYASLVGSICWIIFNIVLGSIFGVVSECVLVVFEILGIINLYKKEENIKKEVGYDK